VLGHERGKASESALLRLRSGQVLEAPDLLAQLGFLGGLLSLLLSSAVLKHTGPIVQPGASIR